MLAGGEVICRDELRENWAEQGIGWMGWGRKTGGFLRRGHSSGVWQRPVRGFALEKRKWWLTRKRWCVMVAPSRGGESRRQGRGCCCRRSGRSEGQGKGAAMDRHNRNRIGAIHRVVGVGVGHRGERWRRERSGSGADSGGWPAPTAHSSGPCESMGEGRAEESGE